MSLEELEVISADDYLKLIRENMYGNYYHVQEVYLVRFSQITPLDFVLNNNTNIITAIIYETYFNAGTKNHTSYFDYYYLTRFHCLTTYLLPNNSFRSSNLPLGHVLLKNPDNNLYLRIPWYFEGQEKSKVTFEMSKIENQHFTLLQPKEMNLKYTCDYEKNNRELTEEEIVNLFNEWKHFTLMANKYFSLHFTEYNLCQIKKKLKEQADSSKIIL